MNQITFPRAMYFRSVNLNLGREICIDSITWTSDGDRQTCSRTSCGFQNPRFVCNTKALHRIEIQNQAAWATEVANQSHLKTIITLYPIFILFGRFSVSITLLVNDSCTDGSLLVPMNMVWVRLHYFWFCSFTAHIIAGEFGFRSEKSCTNFSRGSFARKQYPNQMIDDIHTGYGFNLFSSINDGAYEKLWASGEYMFVIRKNVVWTTRFLLRF